VLPSTGGSVNLPSRNNGTGRRCNVGTREHTLEAHGPMSDLRKALKQAGVVSEKDIRRAQHEKRVERKELGEEGLEAERRRRDEELRAEQARRHQAGAERVQEQRARKENEERRLRVEGLLRTSDLAMREAGQRRFYFAMPDGEVAFVDVSDALSRRLAQGDAAIIDGKGISEREFAIIPGKVATELEAVDRTRILMWNGRG
jgi:uncharacterized protein YaiL (DUF2058 family)